jgi:hypothetical protein
MRIVKPKKPTLPSAEGENKRLPGDLQKKMDWLDPYVQRSSDVILHRFYLGTEQDTAGCVYYVDGTVDSDALYEHILRPLQLYAREQAVPGGMVNLDFIQNQVLTVSKTTALEYESDVLYQLFAGMVIIVLQGIREAVAVDIHGGVFRAISEPPTEKANKGPREGFLENLDMNLGLLRRRLCDPNLVIKKGLVGKRTRTRTAIAYIADVADPGIVQELEQKLSQIDIDGIFDTSYLEQMLESSEQSLFPQFWETERPDKVAAEMLEGRIALFCDGSPQVVMLPSLFIEFFQTSEDYYERRQVGNYSRLFRMLGFFVSISASPLYISLVSFHPELLPVDFLVSLAQSRSQVPFPVIFEVLLQEIIIQFVIEAGLRLPGSIGQTVGVVAGIVLGQAAISAKLASPVVIIVVAVTTICTFSLPSYSMVQATRLLRLPLLLLSSCLGLFGLSIGWLFILVHLSAIENFGVAYLAPFVPEHFEDLRDALFRKPLWKLGRRPTSIPHQDGIRQGDILSSGKEE